MVNNIVLAIVVMALVTYLIRVTPLVLIRREIKNRTVRSFLYYVPYVTLSVMTFPAILSATAVLWSALAALVVAVVLSLCRCKLPVVALAACVTVFAVETLLF
ncbi:MAG: AzlD domain-containing protein [Clostridia bacterium]|nr:AzlD domain-containing protein [Clostridia bacterium]MBQ8717632.1 AzlD domain-containing protein [Clostridia bacterium]